MCTIEIVVFAYMYYVWTVIFLNALPNKKILEASESKAFAEDKMNLALMMVYVFDRAQNITVKGENAGYLDFLFFPQCFQKAISSGVFQVMIVW